MRQILIGVALAAGVLAPVLAQTPDKAAQVARIRAEMKTNATASCITEAKKSPKATDAMVQAFCGCFAGFYDELDDDEMIAVAQADLHKQDPTGAAAAKMKAKMESCGKQAIGQ